MRNRFYKRIAACLILLLFVVTALAGCGWDGSGQGAAGSTAESGEQQSEYTAETDEQQAQATDSVSEEGDSAPFSIRMLDVGQGLCILIRQGDHAMIYDGGGRDHSSYVVSRLKRLGVDKLDYMIASHYDEDHISGLTGVLNTTEVEQVLAPDGKKDTATYDSFTRMIKRTEVPVSHPEAGKQFKCGDAVFQVIGPQSYGREDDNNDSIAVRVSYGRFHCVLTGDAGLEEEAEICDAGYELSSQLYVAGHHGSAYSSGEDLLDAVKPSYVWISCGKDNTYGHPTERTLTDLKERGIQIFRTDTQQEVTVYSDGSSYWFDKKPTDNWEPGTYTPEVTRQPPADVADCRYILNQNSKKIHLPDCDSVQKMKEDNKIYTDASKESLIAQGYEPCGNCKP